jgi:hypothetical protein
MNHHPPADRRPATPGRPPAEGTDPLAPFRFRPDAAAPMARGVRERGPGSGGGTRSWLVLKLDPSEPEVEVEVEPEVERAQRRARAGRVASANFDASMLSPVDARWILATQVARALEGGRAAIIRPEKRRDLVAMGQRVGLRAFDSDLVIAVMQDAARRGIDPLGTTNQQRLAFIAPHSADALTRGAKSQTDWGLVIGLSLPVLTGALLTLLAAWWISGP